jgi:hypothetical protein
MENAAGDDRVEGNRIVELLERDTAVERTVRSIGVDRQDVVACGRERGSYASLCSTSHLEHATW